MESGPGIAIAVVATIIGGSIIICWCVMVICCCIKRRNYHNQTEFTPQAPVVVTSATHTAPGGYPVAQMPVGATTTTYQTQVYAAPYPPQGVPTQMPMPMPMPGGQPPAPGIHPHMAPYPPMQAAAANMNPPTYDMAVSGAGTGAPNHTAYEKQAAYNPNYSMQ